MLPSVQALGFAAVVIVSPPEPIVTCSLVQGIGMATNPLTMPVFCTPVAQFLDHMLPEIQAAVGASQASDPPLPPRFPTMTLSTAYGNPSGTCVADVGARVFQIFACLVFLCCFFMAVHLLFIDRNFGWPHFVYFGQART